MAYATRIVLALLVTFGAVAGSRVVAEVRGWPWLGVIITDINTDDPESVGGPEGGSYVTGVDRDGPSASAGVLRHDIIGAIDGRTAINTKELNCLIQPRRPGEIVLVTIKRGGRSRSIPVTLGHWPDAEDFPRPQLASCGPSQVSGLRQRLRGRSA
jgi:S1-C subfamily serine protease